MKKKYTATRICLIFTAVLVITCLFLSLNSRIGELEYKNLLLETEIKNIQYTYGRPADESTVCFTNIGVWGGELIELYSESSSYVSEDGNGKYVIIKEGASFLSFGDDKLRHYQWYNNGNVTDGSGVLYAAVNRTSLLTEGGGVYNIVEEEGVNETQIIRVSGADKGRISYIPYEAINADSMILHKSAPDGNYYKAYLK